MEFENMNWLAVLIGAAGAFLFGWLVYSPFLFGKMWAEGSGVELSNNPPAAAMALQVLGLAALAIVIGITAGFNALFAAIAAILAAAFLTISNGAFCGKSKGALLVDGAYILGAGVIMIATQGLF